MLKFGIFGHPRRPKIPAYKILRRLEAAGVPHSQEDPDLAVVVGGDGTFGYYGRTLSIPMLFVGVKERGILGSKAKLAQVWYDDLGEALLDIASGRYSIVENKMLSVTLDGQSEDVLTDVYLERGKFAGCLRYAISIKPLSGRKKFVPLTDYAIGNGVIISTSFGAGGYFSYPNRLHSDERKIGSAGFSDDLIGICHVIPTYLARKRQGSASQSNDIRYTVPIDSIIKIKLLRDANARLYGTTVHSKGVPVRLDDTITIIPSKRTARIIKLFKSSYYENR